MLVALRTPARFQPLAAGNDSDFAFLQRRFTPRSVFLEVGGGQLALRAAGYVERAYAVHHTGSYLHERLAPLNLRLVLSDGVRLPVPEESVNVAYTGEFMDRLSAREAAEHLANVRRCLAPGGEYICLTALPARALRDRLTAAGFSSVRYYAGAVPVPFSIPSKFLRISAIK